MSSMQLTNSNVRRVYSELLKKCISFNNLREGKRIHANIIKCGIEMCVFMGNTLVEMYSKCGNLQEARYMFDKMPIRNVCSWNTMLAGYFKGGLIDHARQWFDKMPDRDTVSWNTMIAANDRHGNYDEALNCYRLMLDEGITPSTFTFASVLSSAAKLKASKQGKQIHNHIIMFNCENNVVVGSALVDMYAFGGLIEDARQVFDRMSQRNVVTWNALIAGYGQNGHGYEALSLFYEMKRHAFEPDEATLVSIISACCKNQMVRDARKVFNEMSQWALNTWNAMIAGYVQNGQGEEALQLFYQMRVGDVRSDETTFASVVAACAGLAALHQGKNVHALVARSGFESSMFVGSALVDMYCKCGCTEDAKLIFDGIREKNLVAWNALVAGYSQNGQGKHAVKLFEEMLQAGIMPNYVSYVCVLSACSHAGLIDEGLRYFDLMSRNHQIVPNVVHYTCMIDLLGRAGRLDEAKDLLNTAPFQPNFSMWNAFLSACRTHGNLEMGKSAAECLFELKPQSAGPYVLLANMYAAAGKWADVANIRKLIKESGVKKEPGCSWIAIKNNMHSFVTSHTDEQS